MWPKKLSNFFFYGRRCWNIGRGPNWVDVGLMEKIFSAAEPQVGFAKALPQTKPTRPHQSQMLGTRFSFGLLIFSEDGKKGYGGGGGGWKRESKSWRLSKKCIIKPVNRLSNICKLDCLWIQPTSKCGSRWCNLSSASARLASRNIWRRIWWNQIRILRLMFVIFCQSTLMLYLVEVLICLHSTFYCGL